MTYLLALDIGTEFVKAMVVRPTKDGFDILGVGRSVQQEGNLEDGAIVDIENTLKACEDAIALAEEEADITTKHVVVGMAGELVVSFTSDFTYRRDEPNKPISDKEIKNLIKKLQDTAEQKAVQKVISSDKVDKRLKLINSSIVRIEIDGHKVMNPIGYKGREVGVELYTAFVPLVALSAIQKIVNDLDLELVTVAVAPFAVARALLGDDANTDLSAIIIDIGGGTTDIAMLESSGILGTVSFNLAGKAFTKAIAHALGVTDAQAEMLKLRLDHPNLKSSAKAKIDKTLDKSLEIWQDGVVISLETFTRPDILPSTIILSGGGASLMPVLELLAISDWYKTLPFSRRPIIQLFDPSFISNINNLSNSPLDHTLATALGLVFVGLDTFTPIAKPSTKSRLKNFFRK